MVTMIMLCGLPGSGKSTYAKELSKTTGAIIHASDSLRNELYGNENTQCNNVALFKELHTRIKNDLLSGKSVIYDATNIDYKKRMAFINELKSLNTFIYKQCIIIATPYEDCIKQNNERNRVVPEEVIKRMYLNFTIPQYYEGWDNIHIEYPSKDMFRTVSGLFMELDTLNQDNPHHTLTVGEHCKKCYDLVTDYFIKECIYDNESYDVRDAAIIHDIGKAFTKSFVNTKGETTEFAHYYNHHNVSAYMSLYYLGYIDEKTKLNIIKYVQWHMQPFFINSEKSKNKFIKLVGQEFYDNLMILHEADKSAK